MMKYRNLIIVVLLVASIYIVGIYIYFSVAPSSKNDCPITIPNQQPIQLSDPLDPSHTYTTINDASCLNETRVYAVVPVSTIEDIQEAFKQAKSKNLTITAAGIRHSMGGQAFSKDGLILDMTHFNKIIDLDRENKVVTVQSGATWHDIQLFLHPHNLAIKAMQSTDIFTVGGSISVNAHGMDPYAGSVGSTVRAFTIMLADGSIKKVTQTNQPELFNAVIGGYGLFGIILDIDLELTDNVMYQRDTITMNYQDFPAFFESIYHKKTYSLFYAHLSTSPVTFLQDLIIYGYKKIPHKGPFEPLGAINMIQMRRFIINLSKRRFYAQIAKWIAEKYIDPYIELYSKGGKLSRNDVMHDSVEYLENVLINETDILHEYFIASHNFIPFIDGLRTILKNKKIPLLNASIRFVPQEKNLLNYAPQDMFAIVLYLNQRVTTKSLEKMKQLTKEIITLVLKLNGTFFLPYQLYFTEKQLHQAYPSINNFFELKRKYDPQLLFMNSFYKKYAT